MRTHLHKAQIISNLHQNEQICSTQHVQTPTNMMAKNTQQIKANKEQRVFNSRFKNDEDGLKDPLLCQVNNIQCFIAVCVGQDHENKLLRMVTTHNWLSKTWEEYEKNVRSDELHIKHMYVATSLSIKNKFTHHHSRWHEYYPSNATQMKGWFMFCSEGALCGVIVNVSKRDWVFQNQK